MRIRTFISPALFWVVFWLTPPSVAETKPKTVTSLDYCSDQYVLALADRSQIKALSVESQNTHSFYKERAMGLPQGRAELEDIISKYPDIVIRHWAGDSRLIKTLEGYAINVISANFDYSVSATEENIRVIARAIDQETRGEAYIKTLKVQKHKNLSLPKRDLKALYITPGGVTTGEGTMVDEIIIQSGLINFGQELGLKGWGDLPLEYLAFKKPDLIITGFYDHKSKKVDNWPFARHGFLVELLKTTPTINLPGSLLSCNGLFLGIAVQKITEALNLMVIEEEK